LNLAAFTFTGLPTRVLFGEGKLAAVKDEAARLGMAHPLVITGHHESALGRGLADQLHGVHFDGARMHTPVDVTDQAMKLVATRALDGTIAIGGGSAIGLGKAIAFRSNLPQIAVPTTFAGSEMTNILGETARGEKITTRDAKILPETVIYDTALVATLPQGLAATSGMNAIAHAVEGLYAVDGNPIISLIAEEGIRAMASALPKGEMARGDALYGAWLCGTVLGSVSMALHHKLCHVLGGTFDLPHSDTHAVILPHAVAYNAVAAPDAMMRIARALGGADAAQGLYDLAQTVGAPLSLREIGMPESGLDRAADLAAANPYPNPRSLERSAIRELLDNAFHGHRP
jgi:alcohol dehydrogenase class IV